MITDTVPLNYKLIEVRYEDHNIFQETKVITFYNELDQYYYDITHFSEVLLDTEYINYSDSVVDVTINIETESTEINHDSDYSNKLTYNYVVNPNSQIHIYQFNSHVYKDIKLTKLNGNNMYLTMYANMTIFNRTTKDLKTIKLVRNQISTKFVIVSKLYGIVKTVYLPNVSK